MNLGRDFSIGQRLAAGFAVLFFACAALLGWLAYWHLRSSAAEQSFEERVSPLARASLELERSVLYTGVTLRSYLLHPDRATLLAYREREGEARRALDTLAALPKLQESLQLFRHLAPLAQQYLAVAARAAERQRRGVGGDGSELEAELAGARDAAMREIEAFSARQRSNAQRLLDEMLEARNKATWAASVAGGAALALFAVLALLIAASIRRPAAALLRAAEALASGNWKPALAWAPASNGGASKSEGKKPARNEMLRLARAFGAAAAALERREQRLRAERQIAEASSRSLDASEIADAALRAVCDHLNAEVGIIYRAEGRTLEPIASRALGAGAEPLALGEGVPGQAALERRSVVLADVPRDSAFTVKLGYDAAPAKSVAAVPVVSRGELRGVLVVASLRRLDGDALAFVEAAARQVAAGLENVEAVHKLRQVLAELGEKSDLLQSKTEEIQAQNEELQAQGEEIRTQNEQLKEQAERLRTYAASLQDADRRKNEFLGVLAHELRNPLAAIGNSLYTLAHSAAEEHRQRAEEVIGRQARQLARLVDDLLDVTRIAHGKVQLRREAVDLGALVEECVEDCRAAAQAASVELRLRLDEPGLVVNADRARVCQMAGNLLDNAIKFARASGTVTVALRRAADGAELCVADDGIGMDGAMLARLFEPFSQGDSGLHRKRSGLGLGLALTKALAELHGGSVAARSEGPGKGAELTLRLPLGAPGPVAARAAKAPPALRALPRRILVVEDNADAAHTLKDALEASGHEVRLAMDGEEALAAARAFSPDVILCDIGLPSLDGYQLAQRFRADEQLREALLVAVTGYAGPDDQQRAARAGFDRHFAKPPDLERLCLLIAHQAPERATRS